MDREEKEKEVKKRRGKEEEQSLKKAGTHSAKKVPALFAKA